MSICSRLFTLAFGLVLSHEATAAWVGVDSQDQGSAKFRVLKSDEVSTVVELTIPGVDIQKVSIGGNSYIDVSVPGMSLLSEVGKPALPRISRNIAVPVSADLSLRIVKVENETIALGVPTPSKGSLLRNVNPNDVSLQFSSVYGSGETWPKTSAQLAQRFELRAVDGVTIDFFPVRYDDASASLVIARRMVVEISTGTPKGKSLQMVHSVGGHDQAFLDLYKSAFANFNQFTASKDIQPGHFIREQGRVLVISHPSFAEAMEPWVQWKTSKGMKVKLVTTTEAGSTYTAIKEYIQHAFDTDQIGYVILVGDAEFVPFHPGKSGNAASNEADPMYALVKGADSYPDIFISRMSVKNVGDIKNIVARSINYEKSPDLEGDWYTKSMGIASAEGSPTDSARADELRTMLMGWGYDSVDQFYDPGATAGEVSTALNEGRGYINYIGHGSKASWGTTGFSNTHIGQLNNGKKLPFIVSVACVNGDFGTGTDSFAEAWLKAGTAANPQGAIAVYASSTNQSWVPPTIGQKEIANQLIKRNVSTIGGLFFNGVVAVLEDNDSSAKQTFETWHIFGDATLEVRTGKPTAVEAHLPDTWTVGTQQLTFSAQPGIAVGVMQDGQLIGSAIADNAGQFDIALSKELVKGKVDVTLTGFDRIPLITTVDVEL